MNTHRRSSPSLGRLLRAFLFSLCTLGGIAPDVDAQELVRSRITQRSASGVYLDAGRTTGLAIGDEGVIEHEGVEIARLVLRSVAGSSSYGELVDRSGADPAVGDTVRFVVQRAERTEPPEEPEKKDGAGAGQPQDTKTTGSDSKSTNEEEFVPLLETKRGAEGSQSKNVFHGGFRLGTSLTQDSERSLDYQYHRLSTWGAGERLGGGPWSLEWDLDAYSRDGDGYDGDPDQGDWKLRVDTFVLRRHFEDGGSLGVGRVLPVVLPDLGRIDGATLELPAGEGFRLGAVAGFKPQRDDLGFDVDHPMLAAYGAVDHTFGERTSFWAAAGVMATWFEGAADEHAVLFASRLRRDRSWLSTSGQVDLYSGREDSRSGNQVTRFHLSGSTPVSERVFVDAGMHQYQLPDTDSLRTLFPSDGFFDRGHRRAYLGLREELSRRWSFGQEIAHISGEGTPGDVQWTLRVRRSELFWASSLDASVYRLTGFESDGLGASLGWYAMPAPRLRTQVLLDHHRMDFDSGPTLSTTFLSGFLDFLATDDLTLSGRLGTAVGDDVRTVFVDLSATFRF